MATCEAVLELGGTNATSCSLAPDGARAVVAGRDVFKICAVAPGRLTELQNLRTARSNLTWSCADVKWNPSSAKSGVIATGSTNSQVAIWDVDSQVPTRPVLVLKSHNRSVNRVAWRVQEPDQLLSASQDAEAILWDTRVGSQILRFVDRNSSPVRDVKFNRDVQLLNVYFAAAHENGVVQIWDIRKNSQPSQQIAAHHELVLTVDWHPSKNTLLATGSRDKTVKVWNLNDTSRPQHVIQTIGAVHRVQWRPDNENHLATCALLLDTRIHVWDIHRPYIPIASLLGHKDDVTSIQWRRDSSRFLVSCSKMGALRLHDMNAAYRPFAHINPFGLSWNMQDRLAIVGDRIDRDAETWSKRHAQAPHKHSTNVSRLRVFDEVDSNYSEDAFRIMAQQYRFRDDTPQNLCAHNALVARAVGKLQIAKVWQILQILIDPAFQEAFTAKHDEGAVVVQDDTPLQSPTQEENGPPATPTKAHRLHASHQLQRESHATDSFEAAQAVDDILEFYGEEGDVQTCTAIAHVLHNEFPVNELKARQWTVSYIEQLHRLQMWTVATDLIRNTFDKEVNMMNKRSTTIHTKCPHCRQPILNDCWICPNCHRLTSQCSICNRTVKGLFAWCQGCGHGGHLTHLREWFSKNTSCPTGCGHKCHLGARIPTVDAAPSTAPSTLTTTDF